MQDLSIARIYAKRIAERVDLRVQQKLVNPIKRWAYLTWARPFMFKFIDEEPSEKLHEELWTDYNILKEYFKAFTMAEGIKEGEKLGSVKIPRTASIKEILDLAGV